jgi:hypothetical protein
LAPQCPGNPGPAHSAPASPNATRPRSTNSAQTPCRARAASFGLGTCAEGTFNGSPADFLRRVVRGSIRACRSSSFERRGGQVAFGWYGDRSRILIGRRCSTRPTSSRVITTGNCGGRRACTMSEIAWRGVRHPPCSDSPASSQLCDECSNSLRSGQPALSPHCVPRGHPKKRRGPSGANAARCAVQLRVRQT